MSPLLLAIPFGLIAVALLGASKTAKPSDKPGDKPGKAPPNKPPSDKPPKQLTCENTVDNSPKESDLDGDMGQTCNDQHVVIDMVWGLTRKYSDEELWLSQAYCEGLGYRRSAKVIEAVRQTRNPAVPDWKYPWSTPGGDPYLESEDYDLEGWEP